MTRGRFDRTALLGQRVHVLVTVTWAGEIIRMASTDLVVTDADDNDLLYVGCLASVALENGIDLFGAGGPVSIPIEGVWPVDVPGRIASGRDLSSATAEIAQWIEGTPYEDRLVRVVGRLSDPECGAIDEPVSASIEENPWDDSNLIPDAMALVDPSTAPEADYLSESDLGLVYPVIIGWPGRWSGGNFLTGSQGVWMSKRTKFHVLLVAGHAVGATTVYLAHDAGSTPMPVNVRTAKDLQGRVVTVVDFHQEGYDVGGASDLGADFQPAVDDGVSLYVGWATGGGVLGPSGTAIRQAGDVIEWALRQSSLRVDYGRVNAAKPLLTQFLIDAAIDARVSPWEWLNGNVIPLLPVSMVSGPEGLYPLVWRYWATAADALVDVDPTVDPTVARRGRRRYDSGKIANHFRLGYALSLRTGNYIETAQLGAYSVRYATAAVQGVTDKIRLTALTPGGLGDGIVLTLSGAGALTYSENTVIKTIALQINDAVSTSTAIINIINSSSALVRAHLLDGIGTETWDQNGETVTSTTAGGVQVQGSLQCEVSQRRYGLNGARRLVEKSLDTAAVYDDATADAILAWWALAYPFAQQRIVYEMPISGYGWLERGDVVTLTDADLRITKQTCLVELCEYEISVMAVTLLILPSIGRDGPHE